MPAADATMPTHGDDPMVDAPTPPTARAHPPEPNDADNDADGADARTLERWPDERAIASDYSVVLVVVTASALASMEHGGPVLRRVLARRGVGRVFVDEAHTVSPTSMALYNAALRDFRETLQRVLVLLAASDRPRPQVVGLTSTLPPELTQEVKRRLGMTLDAPTVRCNVDRPELLFGRLPLPQKPNERAFMWLQRALLFAT